VVVVLASRRSGSVWNTDYYYCCYLGNKQQLTSVRRPYIHTWQSYVHTPRNFTNGASLAWRLRLRISTVMFTCGWAWPTHQPIRPLLEEQRSQKWEIPCLGRRWTAVQNLTPLALSSAKKSVTVQIHKPKQTVIDISTPCLLTCVDNNTGVRYQVLADTSVNKVTYYVNL